MGRLVLTLGLWIGSGSAGGSDLHVGGNVSARIEDGRLSMVKLQPR